jgi:hypothetical protein
MHYLAGCSCEETSTVPKHVGWRGFGYDCLRSSGSRGAVDVVAVHEGGIDYGADNMPTSHHLLFIQCKITNPVIPPAERLKVQDLALRGGAVPLVSFKAKDETTGLVRPHFRRLTGLGPRDWAPWEPGEEN